MKIEMGESLVYSWLRHVKECQIVQMNWKMSPMWKKDESENAQLTKLMEKTEETFKKPSGGENKIFKKNGVSQLIKQGECDVLGIKLEKGKVHIFAADVAFHKSGLCYKGGGEDDTVSRVIKKCARTAFCLYTCLNMDGLTKYEITIYFASPKVDVEKLNELNNAKDKLNELFKDKKFKVSFEMILGKEAFDECILEPMLDISKKVSDTAELFLRSQQLLSVCNKDKTEGKKKAKDAAPIDNELPELKGMKIGKIANIVLREMLMDGSVTKQEVKQMQDSAYSKETFGIQHPLLVPCDGEKMAKHYYARPIKIGRKSYQLCNEWCEKVGGNNDRPYLLAWIKAHKRIEEH